MSTSNTYHHPNPHIASERGFGRIGRALRAILLGITVAAACYVAYGFGQLWAEWRAASQRSLLMNESSFDPATFAPVLPLDGPWAFAQLDWNIRSQLIDSSTIAQRFETLAATAAVEGGSQLVDSGAQLIELAEKLQVEPVRCGDNLVYRIDRREMLAQLVVRNVNGARQVVALAAAYPAGRDQWQLFELAPRSAGTEGPASDEYLLPLPPGATRRGGRFADDGRPLLEFVTVESQAETLLAAWKHGGWEICPSDLGANEGFSYLCARGNEVVYAWSADEPESICDLMLVRVENATDTIESRIE